MNKNRLITLCLTTSLLTGSIRAMQSPDALGQRLIDSIDWGYRQDQQPLRDTVKGLIDDGANIDYKNCYSETALMVATQKGYRDIVQLLIQHGARINETTGCGHNALMEAIQRQQGEIALYLIEHGADINQQDTQEGYTPLISAVNSKEVEIVDLLVRKGAQINPPGQEAYRPLMIALRDADTFRNSNDDDVEICKILIARMLKAPMDQAQLALIQLTPEQKNAVNALLGTLKNTPLKTLPPESRKLITQNLIEVFKRKNMVEERIKVIKKEKIKQELLEYVNQKINGSTSTKKATIEWGIDYE